MPCLVMEGSKVFMRANMAVKQETHLNHGLNGVCPPTKFRSRKLKTSKSMIVGWPNLRYALECLISNVLLISVALLLVPFVLPYLVLKKLEYLVVHLFDRSATPLGGQDALWLQDCDNNRLIITTVLLVGRPKDTKKALTNFCQVIYERLVDYRDGNGDVKFPRAKQSLRHGYLQYFFADDKKFNMDNHVFQYDDKKPKTIQELQDIVSQLSSQPLPENRPPWYFCFIPTQFDDNRDAMVFRIHHCVADGVSLSRFLTRILPDHYIPQVETKKFSNSQRGFMLVKAVFILARTILGLVMSFADESILHGKELTGKKRCSWSEPMDLNLVKKIKNATSTTVNDVLVACLTLAMRKYYQKNGVASPQDFIASVPVDLSPSSDVIEFHNNFAVVFVKLPSSYEGVLDILYETKARIDTFKISGEPFAMSIGMRLSIDLLPEIVTKPFMSFISQKATCVMSNVPGPQYLLSVSGNPITYMTFWPPQRNNIGIGISMFSYAGQVIIGVQVDEKVMKDPQTIIQLFSESIQELATLVLD